MAGRTRKGLKDQSRKQMAEVEKRFNRLVAQISGVTDTALLEVMSTILTRAIPKTPIVTGRLRNSGYTAVAKKGNRVQAEVGFGLNGDPDYTIFVHELIEANHPVGQAKFLQAAVEETEGDVGTIIVSHIKGNTELSGA